MKTSTKYISRGVETFITTNKMDFKHLSWRSSFLSQAILAAGLLLCSLHLGTATPRGCNGTIDLVFLIDTSESLRDYDPIGWPLYTWELLKSFAKRIVQNLPVNVEETKVAAVRFSTTANLEFDFNKFKTSINVQDGITKMQHVGGNTNTADALKEARMTFMAKSRGHSRKVVVLMTDGLSNVNAEMTAKESSAAKGVGVEIFTIGITKYIDEQELIDISSEPKTKHFLHAKTFDDLDTLWEKVVYRICQLPDRVPTTALPPSMTPSGPVPCQVEGCEECRSAFTCDSCEAGRYYEGHKCVSCMEHCEVCRSAGSCDRCKIGWYWEPLLDRCEECEVQADLAFLLDNSGSIRDKNPDDESYDNYQLLKDFVKNLIDRLDIGPDTTRVGVIRYSTAAQIEFHLDEYQTRERIKQTIDDMKYGGGHTNTSGGLRLMRNKIFQETRGDRPGVRNVGIVITDGESTKDANLTIPEAVKAKQANITLFVVGVTDQINEVELKGIASDPDDEHFFNQTEIKLLDTIILSLIKHVCAPENPAANSVNNGPPLSRQKRDSSSAARTTMTTSFISLITLVSILAIKPINSVFY